MNADLIFLSRRHIILASVGLSVLAGCGSLLGPTNPPAQIYRLAPAFPAVAGMPVSWQLSIARPITTQTLDSVRIALTRGAAMDYYADAQWNDSVPRLLQSLLVESFERSGRIAAVAADSGGLRADYTLATEIRDFDAQYDSDSGAPMVVVEIEATLLDSRGKAVALLDARQTARAAQNSVASVVAAFNQASGAAITQIVVWALQAPPR